MMWHEQLERSPLGTSFVSNCTPDEALEAIRHSAARVRQAEVAHMLVRSQAIFALKDAGMSVREIAAAVDLSKSAVGRDLGYGHRAYDGTDETVEKVAEEVRGAWGR